MRSRTLRTALVGVLVFSMTVDSATAFHLFGGFRSGGRWADSGGGWSTHRWGGGSSSCAGCDSCGSCGSEVVVSSSDCGCDGGCGGEVITGTWSGGTPAAEHPAAEHPAPSGIYQQQQQSQLEPQQPATVNRMDDPTPIPQLQGDATTSQPPARYPDMRTNSVPPDGQAMPTAPSGRSSYDSIFQPTTPSTTTTTTESSAAATATTPSTTTPSTTTPSNDMFGPTSTTPSTTTPTTTTPTTETPAGTTPATTPTTTPGGLDDLFGPGSSGTTPPSRGTTPPSTTGTTPAGTTPAGGSAPATGAAPAATGTSALDDMFGPSTTTPATPPATTPVTTPAGTPGTAPAGGQPTTTPIDDLFKSGQVLREEGGLASDSNRDWVDNTGRYTTRGRLVTFLDGHVRLIKDNGRTTTVPLYRLSQNDLEFVNRQASAQRATRFNETVQTEVVAVPLASN